jgi:hypothetical protein
MMKEKVARLTPPQESMERTKQGKLKQNKKQKTHPSMNKSACLIVVQGPLTIVCMIMT